MEQNERDPIEAAVGGMIRTDILLEFVREMELPIAEILEGVRRAGKKVISNQDEELQDVNFRLLVMTLCAEITSVLVGDRVEPEEMRTIVGKLIKDKLAENVETETEDVKGSGKGNIHS